MFATSVFCLTHVWITQYAQTVGSYFSVLQICFTTPSRLASAFLFKKTHWLAMPAMVATPRLRQLASNVKQMSERKKFSCTPILKTWAGALAHIWENASPMTSKLASILAKDCESSCQNLVLLCLRKLVRRRGTPRATLAKGQNAPWNPCWVYFRACQEWSGWYIWTISQLYLNYILTPYLNPIYIDFLIWGVKIC